MRTKIFCIIFFLMTIFQQYSCKCPENNEGGFYLSNEDKSIIPYSGNETLKFKNLYGDSIIFNLNGRHSSMDVMYVPDDNSNECYEAYYSVEREETFFNSNSDPSDQTKIVLLKRKNYYSDIYFKFHLKNISNFYVYEGCFFNSMNFYYSKNSIITPLDSIIIGNRLFYSVYEFHGTQNDVLYYSINKGVVGIMDSNGHQWYLVE